MTKPLWLLAVVLMGLGGRSWMWDGPTPWQRFGGVCQAEPRWCLGAASIVRQDQANPIGGPQALEGYTWVRHDDGLVKLAIGTIGNVEISGRGDVDMVQSLTGGLVIAGPGRVRWGSALTLTGPSRKTGYAGAINVDRFDYITFGNGVSLRPDGDRLLICTAQNRCRPLGD